MTHQLQFAIAHTYDTRKTGIEIPLILRTGGIEKELAAKIDTGASHCIFERRQGERLGLDIESGSPEQFGTTTGGFLAYGHEVRLIVFGIEIPTLVYFAADPHFPRNVLGRQGWLDRVRLGLVDYDGQLYLSTYDDPA